MRILFFEICNYRDYPLGGHLTFAKQMAKAMGGGMDLVGCTTNPDIPLRQWRTEEIEGHDYRIFYLCREKETAERPLVPRRITIYQYVKRFAGKISLDDYECIVVQTPEVLLALPKHILPKVCLVMPGVGNPLGISRYPIARHFTRLYSRLFFAKAAKCRCVLAAAGLEAIREFEQSSAGRLHAGFVMQFPTRYDAAIFHPRNKEELRGRYGYSPKETIFVTTGRLNWFKGWKLMLDAYGLYLKETGDKESKFVFIGDGEERGNIRAYAEKSGISGNVELVGIKPLDEVSHYLCMADEFVMGSYAEGWSTSLVEAVASGVPCVITKFSSAKEMVEDGVNGFVAEKRDAELFSSLMRRGLTIPKDGVERKAIEAKRLSVQNLRTDFLGIVAPFFDGN